MQDFYKFLLEKKSTSVVDKYNITSRGKNSSGLDADKGIWYGWSHRAICGFKIGDMLFDPKCDEKLNFNKAKECTVLLSSPAVTNGHFAYTVICAS